MHAHVCLHNCCPKLTLWSRVQSGHILVCQAAIFHRNTAINLWMLFLDGSCYFVWTAPKITGFQMADGQSKYKALLSENIGASLDCLQHRGCYRVLHSGWPVWFSILLHIRIFFRAGTPVFKQSRFRGKFSRKKWCGFWVCFFLRKKKTVYWVWRLFLYGSFHFCMDLFIFVFENMIKQSECKRL